MISQGPSVVGLFGKIPALGDFVRRRLPASFVEPWDEWLRQAILQSKADLGEGWLSAYLTSPLWRFALSGGACGAAPACGVLMPSVDAVNRHYPLTVAATLPPGANPFALVAGAEAWFDAVESLALSCLQPEGEIGVVDAQLDAAGQPELSVASARFPVTSLAAYSADSERWLVDVDGEGFLGNAFVPHLLDRFAGASYGAYSLWWTTGSDHVPPSFMIYRSLPPPSDFAAMMRDRKPSCPTAGELFGHDAAEETEPSTAGLRS